MTADWSSNVISLLVIGSIRWLAVPSLGHNADLFCIRSLLSDYSNDFVNPRLSRKIIPSVSRAQVDIQRMTLTNSDDFSAPDHLNSLFPG